jgi:hypothetical protein
VSRVEERTGEAGWSAAAKARGVRAAGRGGVLRRVLAGLGVVDAVSGRARAEAGRWEAGARGEEMTAALLKGLAEEGWYGVYDRALPGGTRANVDHVLVPPSGDVLVLVDAKLWSRRRGPVRRSMRGELRHGGEDRQGAVRSLVYEAGVLQRLFGVPMVAVMCVHSAPVAGGRFCVGPVTVVQAQGLLPVLRGVAGRPAPAAAAALAAAVKAQLPRYVEPGR